VAILGFALAPATLNVGVRYFAMCVFTMGTYGVNSIILGWASTVCSQTVEKKAVTIAILTSLGNLSFVYTPYLFKDSDKPRYTTGELELPLNWFLRPFHADCAQAMVAMAAFSLIVAMTAWVMRFILRRQNKTIAATGAATKYPY
jgi:hypothetical protein